MLFNLSDQPSIANQFISELRDFRLQKDSMRFRRNLERIGEILAYEISKKLKYKTIKVETQLGVAEVEVPAEQIVLATILRAGLPMHYGMLSFFDQAANAFISAYRMHHKDGSFEIRLEYLSAPDLNDKVLILCDPMLATGSSIDLTLRELRRFGTPVKVHIATVIASTYGIQFLQRTHPDADIWMGALDEELTAKSYIVPGLGDAGDLAFGSKEEE